MNVNSKNDMLYPMTFKPILKQVIWGGSVICPFKGITPVQEGIGESWELSHVEGNYFAGGFAGYVVSGGLAESGGLPCWEA